MEEETTNTKTAFDAAIQNHQLEIIKAAIPYINTSEQKVISVYVKATELMDTISIFQKPNNSIGICSQENGNGSPLDMLNDIKAVCTNTEKEAINMIVNFLNAFQLYNTYKSTFGADGDIFANSLDGNSANNMFDTLKELLTPEQQKMFDTFSIMFNT
jgi:hypothetical protein